MPATMPVSLNLSDVIFIPPEADQYVELVMGYWDYAFSMEAKDNLTPPDPSPEVEKAQQILDIKFPMVSRAVDRTIIARSLKRAFR